MCIGIEVRLHKSYGPNVFTYVTSLKSNRPLPVWITYDWSTDGVPADTKSYIILYISIRFVMFLEFELDLVWTELLQNRHKLVLSYFNNAKK